MIVNGTGVITFYNNNQTTTTTNLQIDDFTSGGFFFSNAFTQTMGSLNINAVGSISAGVTNTMNLTNTTGDALKMRFSNFNNVTVGLTSNAAQSVRFDAVSSGTANVGGAMVFGGNVKTFNIDDSTEATDMRVQGNISETTASSLNKTGIGTLELNGSQTYSGNTTVNSGTLLVNNTIGSGTGSGLVTVDIGGTLGGSGNISGAVNISGGGKLTGGVAGAVGNLKTGALTLASTSIFLVDVATTSSADLIDVTGAVNVTGATLSLSIATGLTFTVGQQLTLIANDSSDLFTGTFANLSEGGTITFGGYTFTGSYLGTNGLGNDLVVTAVPEPSTWLGAGIITVLAGWSQRRKVEEWIQRVS